MLNLARKVCVIIRKRYTQWCFTSWASPVQDKLKMRSRDLIFVLDWATRIRTLKCWSQSLKPMFPLCILLVYHISVSPYNSVVYRYLFPFTSLYVLYSLFQFGYQMATRTATKNKYLNYLLSLSH